MAYLYLITEDDNDDLFFERCLEQLTGLSFQLMPVRFRGGIKEVRRMSRITLQNIQRTGRVEDCYFVIVMDNDRSPEHPHHQRHTNLSGRDLAKQCRFCEIQQTIAAELGPNRANWPIKGAWAVPVEMLESWLLLILHPDWTQTNLPIFPEREKPLAQQYYGNHLTDQLKDLCEQEKTQQNITETGNFCLFCAERLNSDLLAQQSPSFALFKQQIEDW